MAKITDDCEYVQGTIARLEGEIFRLDERIESRESKINTLEEEVQTTKTKMTKMRDDLKDDLRDKMNQMRREMEDEMSRVKNEARKIKDKMNEMENKASKTEDKMRDEINEMKNKARKIEDEMRVMKNTYSTAKIALSFEQYLAKYVYPDEKKNGANQTFTRMKEWLKENEKTPQGKEANKKWNALQEKVSWTSKHENVLKKLRDSLMGLAHPSLDLETAKSRIPDEIFDAEEKKCIEDIIDITKEVEAL